jgi:ketosteroid isomerase-like protein
VTQDTGRPAEVFHRLVEGVCRLVAGDASQVAELAALYAERTRVEHPMALDDTPLLSRDDLRRHFAAGTDMTPITDYGTADIVVHETTDAEVIVAEFRYLGTVGGRSFQVPCVFVMRVRDGEIVESRDYISPLDRERALRAAGDSEAVR